MSRTERLKEEIGWLKVVFGILVATDLSLVAWIAQNYVMASEFLVISCGVAVCGVTTGIVWVNRTAYWKIDELEDL
ncbi:MAG: hypothetical protein R2867_02410 [Caldilineaceae bacterium]